MKINFESSSVNKATSLSKIIILCDHASNYIPKTYKNLGLKLSDVNKHIGWDIGALKVAKKISKNINCSLIHSCFSRLLIDCNRSLKSQGAFVKKSEDITIPGNKNVSKKEKLLRAKKYYSPYHDQINKIIKKKLNDKIVPILVSIHSFTPIYFGKSRPWHIGLLQRKDQRLSSIFTKEIKKNKKIVLGINQPYKLDLAGDFTIPFFSFHIEARKPFGITPNPSIVRTKIILLINEVVLALVSTGEFFNDSSITSIHVRRSSKNTSVITCRGDFCSIA